MQDPIPFQLQPELTGNLLAIRPLTEQDFEALHAVASDPLIWEQHPARNRHKKSVFQKFFQESLASGGALAVIDLKDNSLIGSSRYHGYNPAQSLIEIGWSFLARSHWGGLYNKELKHLMLKHAFQFVDRVIFLVDTDNFRSQKALMKIGVPRTGTQPDAQGNPRYVYQIHKDGFSPAKPRSRSHPPI